MVEMIEEERNAAKQEDDQRADLFASLLKGTVVEDEKGGMSGISDEELMGEYICSVLMNYLNSN
jgi:hypothetical protein